MTKFHITCIESRLNHPRNLYARFKIGPCEQTQTLTLANNLRRALLSELTGMAITAIKIHGIRHEYSAIEGVRESVLDIILNIKQVVLTSSYQIKSPHIAYIHRKGPGTVTAGDLHLPPFMKCVDVNQTIATLANDGHLRMICFICPGKNYWLQSASNQLLNHCSHVFTPSTMIKKASTFLQVWNQLNEVSRQPSEKITRILPIDATFTPIERVNFTIEVDEELDTEYPKEHIFFEIWTNGSIQPIEAIQLASTALVNLFQPFQNLQSHQFRFLRPLQPKPKTQDIRSQLIAEGPRESISGTNDGLNPSTLLDLDIANLNLSLRPYAFLKQANILTIRDLVQHSSQELLMIPHFEMQFLKEVESRLFRLGFLLRQKKQKNA